LAYAFNSTIPNIMTSGVSSTNYDTYRDTTDSVTMSIIIAFDNVASANDYICGVWIDSTHYWNFYRQNNEVLVMRFVSDSGTDTLYTNSTIADTNFHQIDFVKNGGYSALYFNGAFKARSVHTVEGSVDGIFTVGGNGLTGTYTNAKFADMYLARQNIYNVVPNSTTDLDSKFVRTSKFTGIYK